MNDIVEINGKILNKWIGHSEIEKIVDVLADRIRNDYSGKNVTYIVVLKGAVFFATDLIRKAGLDCNIQFIKAKSYGSSMKSTGNVDISSFDFDINGKDIIIIEDIIDSGNTLKKLTDEFRKFYPHSIEIICLLSKTELREADIKIKYTGKEIPSYFVIGYGLDFDESGRQLQDLFINNG